MKCLFILLYNVMCLLPPSKLWEIEESGSRVFGGRAAKKGEFPYVVLLRIGGKHHAVMCTGTLITPSWVLTASHCFENPDDVKYINVIAGTVDYKTGTGHKQKAKAFYVFPSKATGRNDVGIIKTMKPYKNSPIMSSIKLATGSVPNRTLYCTAIGFGHRTTKPQRRAALMWVTLRTTGYEVNECENGFSWSKKEVCAIGAENAHTCHGDSGGPLICHGLQVGILSGGLTRTRTGCNLIANAHVYMYTGAYLDWIKKYVKTLPEPTTIDQSPDKLASYTLNTGTHSLLDFVLFTLTFLEFLTPYYVSIRVIN